MMGSSRERYEAAMTTNHNQGLLHWIKTQHITEYVGDTEGILYIFQKPHITVSEVAE